MTPTPPARRAAAVVVLWAVGIAAFFGWYGRFTWRFFTLGPWGPAALAAFAAVVVAAVAVPPIARWLSTTGGRVRDGLARRRTAAAVAAAVTSVLFLYGTGVFLGRPFRPYVHDEFSYLIQAHQFARGHPWMPPHPLGAFFDSFQLIVSPVYASAYFPGTALFYVPGVWLGLPAWATSAALAGAVAGLLFWIAAELFDGPAAVLAVLLLWSDGMYRALSILVLAQMPLLALGLTATAAWLKWRATGRRRWAAVVGSALGWAAVTRPVDALCFAVPIGLAVLLNLRGRRRRWIPLAVVAAAAAPFAALQMVLDCGITGHVGQTPFRLYADRDYPGTSYGFHPFDPTARPASPLPQKQALYRGDYLPLIREHRPATAVPDMLWSHGPMMPPRLPLLLTQVTPAPFVLLAMLVPVALAGLNGRRAVVIAVAPLLLGLYAGYVFFFYHYTLTAAAAVIVAVLAAAEQVAAVVPARAAPAVPLLLAGLAVAAWPQFDPGANDDLFGLQLLPDVDRRLAAIDRRPAVVLFTYDPARNANEEPVYNAGVAWPDDADVVRAHDLGPDRDRVLFAYYAARQPGRFAYRYDERTRTLTPLGRVTDLAK